MSIKSQLVKWLLPELRTVLMGDISAREKQAIELLTGSRVIIEDMKRTVDSEMAALYFTFPGKKQVPVKTILVKMMEYLDIQMVTRQNAVTEDMEVYLYRGH